MWTDDVDDSEFVGGSLVSPQQAYIKEYNAAAIGSHIGIVHHCMMPQEAARYLGKSFKRIKQKGKTMRAITAKDFTDKRTMPHPTFPIPSRWGDPKESEKNAMDSAKESVEKILEIAKKHGYACVVGFRKMDRHNTCPEELPDMWSGATGLQKEIDALMYDSIEPVWDHYKDGVKDGE